MKRLAMLVTIVAIQPCLSAPARAETIRITSGALDWRPAAPDDIVLAGDGFTFEGHPGTGVFMPELCVLPECTAGTTVDLLAQWVGLDAPGTATLNGVTFQVGGAQPPDAQLLARWTGSLIIPEDFTGGPLSAPFDFTGLFSINRIGAPSERFDLVGSGTATLTFTPFSGFPGAFLLQSARYEFEESAAEPIPEPGTILLLGSGLSALAALRRRRASGRI